MTSPTVRVRRFIGSKRQFLLDWAPAWDVAWAEYMRLRVCYVMYGIGEEIVKGRFS